MRQRADWKSWAVLSWAWLLIALLSFHFCMTLLFVLPHNGLSLTTMPFVERWIEPFFYQKWMLFAPDPLKSTDYLLVECRVRLKGGTHFDTHQVDVSAPLYRAHQQNRLGSAGRLLRAQIYPLFMVAGKRPELVEYVLSRPPGAEVSSEVAKFTKNTERAEASIHKDALKRIARIGSAECDRMHPQHDIVATRVVWRSHTPPTFSKRHEPLSAGESQYTDFGWLDYAEVSLWL